MPPWCPLGDAGRSRAQAAARRNRGHQRVTTVGTALPYSSRTSLLVACTPGSLSASFANPTPSQTGICHPEDSPPELLSPAQRQLPEASEHPHPARHAPPGPPRENPKRRYGTWCQREPARWLGFGDVVSETHTLMPRAVGSWSSMAAAGQGHVSTASSCPQQHLSARARPVARAGTPTCATSAYPRHLGTHLGSRTARLQQQHLGVHRPS